MRFNTQKEMFDWIWDNRPHVSELSGQLLLPKGHPKWHWQFLHVLPKQNWPSYKCESDNILLGTPDEQDTQESNPLFRAKYDELKRRYYKEIYHKTF